MQPLSQMLADSRRAMGLNQTQLARKMGCGRGWYSSVESGSVRPGRDAVDMFNRFFDWGFSSIELDELYMKAHEEQGEMSKREKSLVRAFRRGDKNACFRLIAML